LEGAKLVKEKLGFDDYFRYYVATPQLNDCDAEEVTYEKLLLEQ
jgi:hypothetical protein